MTGFGGADGCIAAAIASVPQAVHMWFPGAGFITISNYLRREYPATIAAAPLCRTCWPCQRVAIMRHACTHICKANPHPDCRCRSFPPALLGKFHFCGLSMEARGLQLPEPLVSACWDELSAKVLSDAGDKVVKLHYKCHFTEDSYTLLITNFVRVWWRKATKNEIIKEKEVCFSFSHLSKLPSRSVDVDSTSDTLSRRITLELGCQPLQPWCRQSKIYSASLGLTQLIQLSSWSVFPLRHRLQSSRRPFFLISFFRSERF